MFTRPGSCITAIAAIALLSGIASGYDDGPPDGFAGDPPDNASCVSCHAAAECPPNGGDGLLELLDLPAAYDPGQTYRLRVRLRDPGQLVWGFELTVIDNTDPNYPFDDGGTLALTDPTDTQLSEDSFGTKDYLKQTEAGNFRGTEDGPVQWDFAWTAPDPSSPSVTFYLAGNAGNGDGFNSGDCIYTLDRTLYPQTPSPAPVTSWGRIKSLWRAP